MCLGTAWCGSIQRGRLGRAVSNGCSYPIYVIPSVGPSLSVRSGCSKSISLVEHIPQGHFPKAGPQAHGRIGGNAQPALLDLVDHRPAEGVELIEERFFDKRVFRQKSIQTLLRLPFCNGPLKFGVEQRPFRKNPR